MRLITITITLGALLAARTDDPRQEQAAAGPEPAADFAKTMRVMEGPLKELLSAEVGPLLEEPVGSPIHAPGDEAPFDTTWLAGIELPGAPQGSSLEPIAKGRVERPLRLAIEPLTLPAPDQPVRAGLVAWHEDLASARVAARKSGKPVLLFQLLGRLDEAFC